MKKERNTKSTHTLFSPRSNMSPLFTTRVQRHTDKPIPEHSQGGPAIRVAARERIVEDPGAGGHQQVSTTRRRRDRGKGETIVHGPTKRTYQLGRGTKRTLWVPYRALPRSNYEGGMVPQWETIIHRSQVQNDLWLWIRCVGRAHGICWRFWHLYLPGHQ